MCLVFFSTLLSVKIEIHPNEKFILSPQEQQQEPRFNVSSEGISPLSLSISLFLRLSLPVVCSGSCMIQHAEGEFAAQKGYNDDKGVIHMISGIVSCGPLGIINLLRPVHSMEGKTPTAGQINLNTHACFLAYQKKCLYYKLIQIIFFRCFQRNMHADTNTDIKLFDKEILHFSNILYSYKKMY